MANIMQAVEFVIKQEDCTLAGEITHAQDDLGGTTRYGLTERWHPALEPKGFFGATSVDGAAVPCMDAADALALARQTYADEYGEALLLADVEDDAVAASLLSFAVVGGNPAAVRLFQQAIAGVTPAPGVTEGFVDGHLGPGTIQCANAVDARQLLQAFVQAQKDHFQSIVAEDQTQARFLDGWTNRAEACLTYDPPPVEAPSAGTPSDAVTA